MTLATNRTEPLGFRATRAANDAFRAICYKRGISMSEALNDALADARWNRAAYEFLSQYRGCEI